MTGKERALRAIRGKETDRPSALPSIDVAYAPGCIGRKVGECFRKPDLHAKALMGALDLFPEIDGLYVNLCLSDDKLTMVTVCIGMYRKMTSGLSNTMRSRNWTTTGWKESLP